MHYGKGHVSGVLALVVESGFSVSEAESVLEHRGSLLDFS